MIEKGYFLSASVAILVLVATLFKLVRFYRKWLHLPHGPFALPVIGSFWSMRKHTYPKDYAEDMSHIYGPVYTVFEGDVPFVYVMDANLVYQVSKDPIFSARPVPERSKEVLEGSVSIFRGEMTGEWSTLRNLAQNALRKVAVSDYMADVVTHHVDELISVVGEKRFDSVEYMHLLYLTIFHTCLFGSSLPLESEELKEFRSIILNYADEIDSVQMITVPTLRELLLFSPKSKSREEREAIHEYIRRKLVKTAYLSPVERGRCIMGIMMLEREKSQETADCLRDRNLINVTLEYLSNDIPLRWMLLFMAKYPDYEEKMRREVCEVLGDERPSAKTLESCHMVKAFMFEVLRIRSHHVMLDVRQAVRDVQVGGFLLPKGTNIKMCYGNALRHSSWIEPFKFWPERFLDQELRFLSCPNRFFLPFGAGRRSCPGYKFVVSLMFFAIVRLLQQTSKLQIPDLESVPMSGRLEDVGWCPHGFDMVFHLKEVLS